MMKNRQVGILLFEDAEVLDFSGPFEVFSRARLEPGPESRRCEDTAPFKVSTVARTREPVRATGGLTVNPDYGFDDCPDIDILVVPGGFGTRPLMQDAAIVDWIRERADSAEVVASVCTGALLLARAGLLEGRRATTHHAALDLLQSQGDITVERGARFVDDGVISSAGVAAGIDMAFYIVEKLCGAEVADETASYIEYPRSGACSRA